MSNILEKANQIVNERSEEKERQYGPFHESMERAADIYNRMSPEDQQITTTGMYRAMIALKLSREAYAHKEDNLLDAVAYMGSMNDYMEQYKVVSKPQKLNKYCKMHKCSSDCVLFNDITLECTYNKK